MEQGRTVNLRRQVSHSIEQEISAGRAFVIAFLAATSGSTYHKAGTRMIVRQYSSWTGMLSGGCLESGIAEAALAALDAQTPSLLQYDTTDDADITLGTGLGCKGSLIIALIPFGKNSMPLNNTEIDHRIKSSLEFLGLPSDSIKPAAQRHDLVVFGAGVDAKPLCQWASDLDWNVIVVDPRPAYATSENFPEVSQIFQTHLTRELADEIFHDKSNPAFVIIMTHNFNRDVEILKILSQYDLPYIGLLGPEKRAHDIMKNLTPRERHAVAPVLQAPMGLSLGGYGPEAIALATLAETQSKRFQAKPESRSYQAIQRKPDVIILAAGLSSRMGSPKQLIKFNNETLVRRAVSTAAKTGTGNIFVVVGSSSSDIKNELSGLSVTIIDNPDFHEGIASSIVAGIKGLPADSRAALIMTCDQPLITADDLRQLITIFDTGLSPIAAMTYDGVVGVPALFDTCVYPDLLSLKGDRGAKAVIQRYSNDVATLHCPRAATDCDTPDDILKINSIIESANRETAT
jgi:molybdenum cofactor cytidylyltransferase